MGAILSAVDAGPCGTAATSYGRDIQRILKKHFGLIYTLDGMPELLHRWGYYCLQR